MQWLYTKVYYSSWWLIQDKPRLYFYKVIFKGHDGPDGKVGVEAEAGEEAERPRHHSNSSDDVSSEGKRDLIVVMMLVVKVRGI